MNIKALFLATMLVANPITAIKPEIPMSDFVLHMDKGELVVDLKKHEQWDPALKITYIVAGTVVTTAIIAATVILLLNNR